MRSWLPSQYGLFFDAPQRQSAIVALVRICSSYELVNCSRFLTKYGPFLAHWMDGRSDDIRDTPGLLGEAYNTVQVVKNRRET